MRPGIRFCQASSNVRIDALQDISIAHRDGKINFDDLQWKTRKYDAMASYAQSKLADLSRCSAWYRAASSPRQGRARLRIKLAARPKDAALELLVVGVILAMMLILSLR